MEKENELGHFFAWARSRAYLEFEKRMTADPSLDPNWTFSEIMQELLDDYRKTHQAEPLKDHFEGLPE